LWTALEDSGLSRAWVPEDQGGAGAEFTDGFDILVTAGRYAVAVPLAETLLAGWLLAKTGIMMPYGPLSVAVGNADNPLRIPPHGSLSGTAKAVPFAGDVDHFAVLTDKGVALAKAADCNIETGVSMADDAMSDVTFDSVTPLTVAIAPNGFGIKDLMLMGATIRSAQMAGGLQAILDLAVDYAKERVAFGRPIARFQAVQHNLAQLGGETAAATAGSAADAIANAEGANVEHFDQAVFLEVAAAKIRTGEAVGDGTAITHQTFGAIGFTNEHVLQRHTRRLWAWRDDYGSESEWAVRLGKMIAANDADELWPLIASR
jgi:acyl-CoA dehydrogenase